MRRRVLAIGALLVALIPLTPTAEAAAATAATGARCTIVGTSGDDVLVGTSRRDVLCGRGGDDVLRGRGGDDVLDGGSGRDRLDGGSGADTLLGERGSDQLTGGSGADRLSGGSGNDKLAGEKGDDTLAGDSGDDRISGDAGRDLARGGSGADVLRGGTGDDALLGGSDRDALFGEAGNDDLNGEAAPDDLDGGEGTNWCTVDAEDTQKKCKYDRTGPEATELTVEPGSVDVTDSEGPVVLRVHVVDDTGVDNVVVEQVGGAAPVRLAQRVAGTVRDGWWEFTSVTPRFARPGAYDVNVQMFDRVGHSAARVFSGRLTVINRDPDTTAPLASDVQVWPVAVDVRGADATVRIDVRITDNKAGLESADVALVWTNPTGAPVLADSARGSFTRTSGTEQDGRYTATVVVPRGATGGTWSPEVRTWDRVGNQHTWLGDALFDDRSRYWAGGGPADQSRLPGGSLQVTGSALDTTAPAFSEVRVVEPVIDTLATAATVTLEVHASDGGDGVRNVQADFVGNALFFSGSGVLVEGTPADGWWRVQITFAQGVAPGRYVLRNLFVGDRSNIGLWGSPASDTSGTPSAPAERYRTAAGQAWDGAITVVENPAVG